MKVLVTGFDPFGLDTINPSIEAVKMLPDCIDDIEVVKLEVPTVFYKSIDTVIGKIEEIKPDAVICVGQAGGRVALSIEKVAINYNNASISDNEGNKLVDTAIYDNGPVGYFSTLPIGAMLESLKKENIKGYVSYSAGTFVCNHLMYGVLHYVSTNNLPIKAGFIHVPYIDKQVVDKPEVASVKLEEIVEGLTACIKALPYEKCSVSYQGIIS